MNKNILFINCPALIKYGIMWGFQQNGWNTYLMDGADYVLYKDTQNQISGINKYVEMYKIDIIFWDFGVGADFKAIYQYCKIKGIAFVCWGIEDTCEQLEWLDQTINYCDYYFTTTEELIPIAKQKYNKDIDLLLFGVNNSFHKPSSPNKEKFPYQICLVGNNYSSREDKMDWFLGTLINVGYDVAVWGADWWISKDRKFNLCKTPDIYKGRFEYQGLGELYSTCPIALGVQCSDSSNTQMSMRNFEYAGWSYNSCLLSFYTKAQENIFGDLIYLPKNQNEVLDMAFEILTMTDEQRIEKSNKLREFVYKNHSYIDRAKNVINRSNGVE